jgi:hypothetical protein
MECHSSQIKRNKIKKKKNENEETVKVQQYWCLSHMEFSTVFRLKLLFVQELQIIVPHFEILATVYHLSSWAESLTGLQNENHITVYFTTF